MFCYHFLSSNTLQFLVFSLVVVTYEVTGSEQCSRHKSRTARKTLEKNFFPTFQTHGYTVPDKCQWNLKHDIYLMQEQNKETDELGRWVCNICGKIFVSEYHIDLHMTNRHQDHLLNPSDPICLADSCDILRCDILSGDKRTSYWDEALCNEARLKQLMETCEKQVTSCCPDQIKENERFDFISKLIDSTCSSLTCDKFYDADNQEESIYSSSVYIILIVVLGTALVLYYTVAIIHFFTDESFIKDNDEFSEKKSRQRYTAPMGSEIRNRYTSIGPRR
ncbi:uncharacterized protein [Antedon mediterranea]|uniref:uncharacterized protein n=1 Tax=Antedon mediterranea TaxID=105859 RepID=UPI003AF9175F